MLSMCLSYSLVSMGNPNSLLRQTKETPFFSSVKLHGGGK